MGYGDDFILTLFTNDPLIARSADQAGINRIGLDLERIGKRERQGHLNTWISDHEIKDLPNMREAVVSAELFVRTNPIHPNSKEEIDFLIEMGAQTLMLPMFRTVEEAADFIKFIDGRARVSLLVETAQAAVRIRDIIELGGIDEVFVGLNDLHLSLALNNHFEALVSGLMDMLSKTVCDAGIRFGFGGIGRVNDTRLPISGDLIYAQYPRLKATSALVSRVFFSSINEELDLSSEIVRFRDRMNYWGACDPNELDASLKILRQKARTWRKGK